MQFVDQIVHNSSCLQNASRNLCELVDPAKLK